MKRKPTIYILLICTLLVLSSCTGNKEIYQSESNDLFTITITADSSKYSDDTAIECYATLKYIGDESITVYHYNPLVTFNIRDNNGYNHSGGMIVEYLNKTFQPGDELHIPYKKVAGWIDSEGTPFDEEFAMEPNLILPKGEYRLSANIYYYLDEVEILKTQDSLTATINIVVK